MFTCGKDVRNTRNPNTNEVRAVENRVQGVCLSCAAKLS